jgi:hypothetical protein
MSEVARRVDDEILGFTENPIFDACAGCLCIGCVYIEGIRGLVVYRVSMYVS